MGRSGFVSSLEMVAGFAGPKPRSRGGAVSPQRARGKKIEPEKAEIPMGGGNTAACRPRGVAAANSVKKLGKP